MRFEIKETNNIPSTWILEIESTINDIYTFDNLNDLWEEIKDWLDTGHGKD